MRFTSIALRNWRNFKTVDRVELQQRVVIIGPNACGKSNLLDAFRFLRDVASPHGGLRPAIDARGGLARLRCLAAKRVSHVTVDVEVGDAPEAPTWRYKLTVNQRTRKSGAAPTVVEEVIWHCGHELLRRPRDDDRDDPELLTQTHLEQVSGNRDYRPLAEFLQGTRYLHVVPQLVREPERGPARSEDPYGGSLLEQIATTTEGTRQRRLSRILGALKAVVPQIKELGLERDAVGVPHLKGLYEHWRPNAGWQSERDLSDGTLRLIGLLWSILEGTGPLLLEEPELSLHADVVQHIPQLLARVARTSRRQIILSTHSAELLKDTGLAPDEVLLMRPSGDGTTVQRMRDRDDLLALTQAGLSMAEVALPETAPRNSDQLLLFGDK